MEEDKENILGRRRKGQVASHNPGYEKPTSKPSYTDGDLLLTSPKGIFSFYHGKPRTLTH